MTKYEELIKELETVVDRLDVQEAALEKDPDDKLLPAWRQESEYSLLHIVRSNFPDIIKALKATQALEDLADIIFPDSIGIMHRGESQ